MSYNADMIELALPAGSLETAISAFNADADAVYFGMKEFSARKGAANFSIEDLSKIKRYASEHSKKIYVTVNTLVDDSESAAANRILAALDFYEPDGVIIQDLGDEHVKTGYPIVYTSADSVFQIAAHNDVIPLEELYRICQIAREIMQGEHGVGRIIARPFVGEKSGSFTRTANRRDFSLLPPQDTLLDILSRHQLQTIGVGKISDIFAGKGISQKIITHSNDEGMQRTIELCQTDFTGLCFVNLVEFDMLYGHRNNPEGYTQALNRFDAQLAQLLPLLRPDDLLFITADHGCDPATPSTDHSREYVPLLCCGKQVRANQNLGTRTSFGDLAVTIADYFGVEAPAGFSSFLSQIFPMQ